MIRSTPFKGLALAALLLPLGLGASSPSFTLTGFTVNPALIISIYNVAKQNNDQVTQLPPDLMQYSSVVQILLNNSGAPGTAYFKVTISDQACGNILSNVGWLESINSVGSGQSTIGAAEIKVSGNSYSGTTASQCFQDEIKNNFSDPSKMADSVNKLMRASFMVCLQLCDSLGNVYGNPVCTPMQFFNQQSTNTNAPPILIMPHNNDIQTFLPQFIWTAATSNSLASNQIRYRIEVMEGSESGEMVQRVETGAGDIFYQWTASDRELKEDTKYYWRATALGTTGDPLIDGSGANITKWFRIRKGTVVAVNLGDIDAWTRAAAAGEQGVKNVIDKMKIDGVLDPPSLADDLFEQLKSGKAKVVGVEVSTY